MEPATLEAPPEAEATAPPEAEPETQPAQEPEAPQPPPETAPADPPPPAGATPSELEKLIHEIEAAERAVSEAERVWEIKKEAAADAKRDFDKAVEELRQRIRSHSADDAPLFQQPAGGGTVKDAIGAGLDQHHADQDKAAFDAATLGQLGLSGKLKENLEADGIRTGKELAEWFNAVPRRKVRGVGEDPDKGGLRKIVEAMEEFYLKRQREREGKTGPKLHDGRNSLVGPGADAAPAEEPAAETPATEQPVDAAGEFNDPPPPAAADVEPIEPAPDPDRIPLSEAMGQPGRPKRSRK